MPLSYGAHSALLWTPVSICITIVAIRLFVRTKLRNLGVDDLFMALSVILFLIAVSIGQAISTEEAFSKRIDVSRELVESTIQLICAYLAMFFGKASVALLLLRVLESSSARLRRWLIFVTLGILGLVAISSSTAVIVPSCRAPRTTWLVSTCAQPKVLTGLLQTWNFYSAFFDIVYSILPLTFIYVLKVSPSKKVYLAFSLSIGWTAAAFSILRAVAGYAWPSDTDKQTVVTQVATDLEPALIIICGSLASLTPLFDYIWKGRPLVPRGSRSGSRAAVETKTAASSPSSAV